MMNLADFGSQSMVAPLKRVLMRRPDGSFAVEKPAEWNYSSQPILEIAQEEHDGLAGLLRDAGAEVLYHDQLLPALADAIFVYDPVLMTSRGAVILSMGKELRRGEEAPLAGRLKELGIPIVGTLTGEARAEGGDLFWLDNQTLCAGCGFRTNPAGIEQLRLILEPLGVRVIAADLPYFTGPVACLHLLSLLSLVSEDCAVVYLPLLPVVIWRALKERGFRLIEVPAEEFETMGPNILALGKGRCVALEGNPVTRQGLENAGLEVRTYRGNELSLKAEGGPTCLTLPLLRQ